MASTRLALALIGLSLPALAASPPPAASSTPNVRVTFEVGKLEGETKTAASSYQLVASGSGGPAQLISSSRVPIPSGDPEPGTTAFTYQNVGMEASLEVSLVGDDRIRLHGRLEASVIRERESTATGLAAPVIGTLRQDFDVVVQDGRSVRLARVEEPGAGTVYIDVVAELSEARSAR